MISLLSYLGIIRVYRLQRKYGGVSENIIFKDRGCGVNRVINDEAEGRVVNDR